MADTARLQDAVTHTAGCDSRSTSVAPSLPGVTRSTTRNATAIMTSPSRPKAADDAEGPVSSGAAEAVDDVGHREVRLRGKRSAGGA
jgi:hypothetical protein